MKRISIALILSALSAGAMADNTVRFEGEVSDQTCNVSVNGEGSPVILLPTVNKDVLSATTVTAETNFTISISDCDQTANQNWGIRLVGNGVTQQGDLANRATENPATGVAIRIGDKGADGGTAFAPINLSAATVVVPSDDIPAGETSASHILAAGYVLESAGVTATAGYVSSSLQYAVTYQ